MNTSPATNHIARGFLLAGLFAASSFAEPVDLAPRFEYGTEVSYATRSIIEHRVRVDLADVDETVKVQTESGMLLRVDDVDSNGAARVLWTLEYIAIESDGAIPGLDASLNYDSRRTANDPSPFASIFAGLINRPVAVRVSRTGHVESFDRLDNGGGIDPLASITNGFFSKEAFEQLPLLITAGAPAPAKVRTQWSRKMSIDMPLGVGSLMLDQQLNFGRLSPRRGFAHLEMTGTITKASAAGTPAQPGAAGLQNLESLLQVKNGKLRGHFTWDHINGQLVEGETLMELETVLNSPLGEMQLGQKMSSSVRRIEPNPRARHRTPPRKPQPDKPAKEG